MPKISELAYAGELGAANYILGIRDGVTVRFPIEVFEDEPIVNSSFTVLTDTPANYVDQAGKLAAVNSTETGLEFVDPPEGAYAFTDLTDTPNTYTDQGGKLVKVNSGGTGLEFGDAPASTFLALSDTPDSYSAYVGKVVAAKADGSGLEFVSPTSGSYTIVDLSSATVDYALAPGEVAKITYSSATSVPLHIATVEGIYDLTIINASVAVTDFSSAASILLRPNNSTVTAGAINWSRLSQYSTTVNGYEDSGSQTAFIICNDKTGIISESTVFTYTTRKLVRGCYVTKIGTDQFQQFFFHQPWVDTSTSWTSLGTLVISTAQSGIVVVRRII